MKRIRELNPLKREAILDAAINEFNRSGYAACSMDIIAKDANVSKATVYKHFENKRGLFISIMLQLKEIMQAHHFIKYDPSKSLEEQLLDFAFKELELLSNPKNAILLRIGMLALMQNIFDLEPLKSEMVDNIFLNLKEWFNSAREDGRLDFEDTDFISTQFVGSIKVFAFFPQLMGEAQISKAEQKKVAHKAVEVLLLQYAVDKV